MFTGLGHSPGIPDTNDSFSAFGGEPSINSSGTVAFHGEFDAGGEGIFRGSGGSITTIADTGSPLSGFGGITSINASGTVAFRATVDDGGDGIFSGNGGQIKTIADSTGPFASFITNGPWINNDGTVAFFATLDTGDEGIFTGSGGPITTIADASGSFASFGIYPSINSTGMVAFFATFDAGGEGIFTGNGGPLTTIADTSGPFTSFDTRRLSIDGQGVVTFAATLDTGGGGWFRGDGGSIIQIPDPEATFRAIVQSNPLFSGATVLHSPYQGMNASGQYAFFAQFADGTEAIYRTDPIVPFTAFTAEVTITLKPRASDDAFKAEGNFTLGAASNGIGPLTESVTLQVGTFSTTIPAGSFTQDKKGQFTFDGVINGATMKVQMAPAGGQSFTFKTDGKDVDLTGTVNPVIVGLTIGDDNGSAPVTAAIK